MNSVMFSTSYVTHCCFLKSKTKGGNFRKSFVCSSVVSAPKNLQSSQNTILQTSVRIGVLGASGYTGSE
ncbi:putative N-acetyl-gamma-glutamyl-phosphate reductase chloroplastic, partial [Bienertia sinuspersici]